MQISPQVGGYDRAITVFSPDGRLFQVEYAREAVKRGTTAIGIKSTEGIVLMVDKRVTTKLLEIDSIEKIFEIDEHIGSATSGLVADARVLIDRARVEAQIYRLTYDEKISVETLAKRICDHKQTYTQYGGVRPYGTALIIAGVDANRGGRVFETDPSGALLEYKATAIGSKRNVVMELFEEKYKDDIDLDGAILLGMEALYLSAEGKFDVTTVEAAVVKTDKPKFTKLKQQELEKYVNEVMSKVPKDKKEE
ncbi:proteasome endopeptidase complex, archaeal, alpha subunit [Methanosarcinales archaeon]|nr:MAG: proteasome endopeptidase complex, archaeal, alpha subunit [Methanosarcinales archaeon]